MAREDEANDHLDIHVEDRRHSSRNQHGSKREYTYCRKTSPSYDVSHRESYNRDALSSRTDRYREDYRKSDVDEYNRRLSRPRSYKYYDDDRDDNWDRKSPDRVISTSSRSTKSSRYERPDHQQYSKSKKTSMASPRSDDYKKDGSTYLRSWGDWDQHLSSNNKAYYWNRITGVSQWTKPDEVIEMESRSSRYRDDERREYRGHDDHVSSSKSRRRDDYEYDSHYHDDKSRRYSSRKQYSGDYYKRSDDGNIPHSSHHRQRSSSNPRDSRIGYDRDDERKDSSSHNNHHDNGHYPPRTSTRNSVEKSSKILVSMSGVGSASLSTPSDSDSKSDEFDESDRRRPTSERKYDEPFSSSRKPSSSMSDLSNDESRKSKNDQPENGCILKENIPTSLKNDGEMRKRSITPLEDALEKRARTSSDGSDAKLTSRDTRDVIPIENGHSSNHCPASVSLSPSQVTMSNLKEIMDSFAGAPQFPDLSGLSNEEALKTIHQMLRHLQQMSKNDVKGSPAKTPLSNSVRHNSKSMSRPSYPQKSASRMTKNSVYDNLKSNDIKDDLNRLLPRTSPASEASSSSARSPASESQHFRSLNRGLLTSSSALVNSAKSSTPSAVPSLTPSLASCFKEDLITHVQGWLADSSERQVSQQCDPLVFNLLSQSKKYAEEAHNLGSINCTRVSAELKMARSLVRLTEIQATLQEQRILFVRQQITNVEEWKGKHSTVIPANAISGNSTHQMTSMNAEKTTMNGPKGPHHTSITSK